MSSIPERIKGEVLTKWRYVNLPLPFTFTSVVTAKRSVIRDSFAVMAC